VTTYPLDTLAATVDATGIVAPSYEDIFASLQASFRSIYGSDVYLEADSQDGQWLAIMAAAINDSNSAAIAAYNALSPTTALGAGLSSVVKINGIERLTPSASTVDLLIVGVVGTQIVNGQAGDGLGTAWALPALVEIPDAGEVVVTATATEDGAVPALPASVTRILTPTRGWQSVTNAAAATAGAPVETDAALRQRQAASTARPALAVMDSIVAEVANLAGVQRFRGYENDSGGVDGDGIPAHAISFVVEGGDVAEIAQAIADKKTPGTQTYGTTAETVYDSQGVPNTINFYRPTIKRVTATINIQALAGYVSSTGEEAAARLAAYVSALDIGGDVYNNKAVAVSSLYGTALEPTFNVTSIELAFYPAAETEADLAVAFNEAADLDLADITVVAS